MPFGYPSKTLPSLVLTAAIIATAGIYWIGLQGPFILDDDPNLSVVQAWLNGKAALNEVLFPNASFLQHRSLSMATFAMTAWLGSYDPFPFKLWNLAIHLACGLAIYAFLSRLFRRDPQFASNAKPASAILAMIWLLHPLHASTVLYVVQRMAQLPALACLLGLWLYVCTRDRIERGELRWAWPLLLIGVPAITVMGIMGKQNAAVLPALCLVIELAWYSNSKAGRAYVRTFFALTLAMPAALVAAVLLIRPSLLLGGYIEYDFSPWERLITQGRVYCEYISQLLAPHTPSMGVFTDGYITSRGLLSPPSTLISIAAIALVSVAAVVLRKRFPGFFGGWFFFLVAHAVEGTILPLEMYYEHRNYLPRWGCSLHAPPSCQASGTTWASGVSPTPRFPAFSWWHSRWHLPS